MDKRKKDKKVIKKTTIYKTLHKKVYNVLLINVVIDSLIITLLTFNLIENTFENQKDLIFFIVILYINTYLIFTLVDTLPLSNFKHYFSNQLPS
jgi:hypothetical protein